MRRMGTVAGSGCALLACLGGAPSARANGTDSSEQKAAAQVLFEQGRSLVEKGQFADACPKFDESQRLDPGIGTVLWLADCYENTGRTASAWAAFKEAAAAAALHHDDRESVARDRAEKLEANLARLTIVVPPAAAAEGLQVHRDGTLVGSAEWGLGVPVDPGIHTIAAVAAGRRPWSVTVQVASGLETSTITVPVLQLDIARTEPPSHFQGGEQGTSAADRTRGNGQRLAGIAVSGAGLASVLVGTVFSFMAKSTYDGANTGGDCLPDNECNQAGKTDRSRARSLALVATVTIGVGAAALAGGVIFFFAAPRPSPAPVALALAPRPTGGSMRLTWAW
jgi:hypothetical protein